MVEIKHHLGWDVSMDITIDDEINYLRPKINFTELMPLRKYYIE